MADRVPLLKDSTDAYELKKRHSQIIEYAIKSKKTAVQNFKELLGEVEESYLKSRIARILGLSFTIGGSASAILGFGLGAVTFGWSLGLISLGALLSALGAIVIGCAEVWYMTVARSAVRNIKIICEVDSNKMEALEEIEGEFDDHPDPPPAVLPHLPSVDVSVKQFERRPCKPRNKPMARTLFCGYKVFDGITDVTLSVVLAITRATARSGIQIGVRTLWNEVGETLQAISIGATALDAIFIPIDGIVLFKSLYDIYKYKNGNGSNSCTASKIARLIEKFKQQIKNLEQFQGGSTFRTDSS